jgi:hypothetical protein
VSEISAGNLLSCKDVSLLQFCGSTACTDIPPLFLTNLFCCRSRGPPCCATRAYLAATITLRYFVHTTLVRPTTVCQSFLRSESGCCHDQLLSEDDMKSVADLTEELFFHS